jgi:hypothetical protein
MGQAKLSIIGNQTFYLMCSNLQLHRALRAFKNIYNFLTKKKRATTSTAQKIAAHT